MKKLLITLCALALIVPAYAQNFSGKLEKSAVKAVCDAVSDWEVDNFENSGKKPDNWTSGALFRGMYEWAELTENAKAFKFLEAIGKKIYWRPGPKTYHADHTTVLQTWIKMYGRLGKEDVIRPAMERLYFVATHPSTAPLRKDHKIGRDDRWSWCDALFMAPPAYAQMYALTGDRVYLEYMENEFKACTDSLYDAKEHLYYRDCKYFTKKEANGKKVFWGRGNGWVFAGIPLILEALPADYANRAYFTGIFSEMADRIVSLQDKKGHWHTSMLDPDSYPLPENSASAFFCYGLAWGLRNGVLSGAKYKKALEKGWAALVSGVHDNGMPGYIQRIAAAPGPADFDSTEIYGAGGILLAGSEITRLISK